MKVKSPKYYIWTIGCQMNKVESERLSGLFEQSGYQAADSAEEADVIVLNSCVVRQHAEDKVVNKLNNLRAVKRTQPDMKLAVTGCIVNSDISRLKEIFPHVDYFFKPGDFPSWMENPTEEPLPPRPSVSSHDHHSRM